MTGGYKTQSSKRPEANWADPASDIQIAALKIVPNLVIIGEKNIFEESTSACFGIGRLGNQMCNFASQFALYKEFGINGYLSSFASSILNQIFQMKPQNNYDTNKYVSRFWIKYSIICIFRIQFTFRQSLTIFPFLLCITYCTVK